MNGRESVTERNVARLLARAYAPVAPREAFRAALERAARESVGRRERADAPRWIWGLAAAAAAVLALIVYRVWSDARPDGPEAILQRGLVAVLDDAQPGWRALAADGEPVPYALGAGARLATPDALAARVELDPGATVDVARASAIALERTADDCVVLRLERGRARLHAGADERELEPGVETRWCAPAPASGDATAVVRPGDGDGRAQVPTPPAPVPAVAQAPQIRGTVSGGDARTAEADLVALDSFRVSCVPALQLPRPRSVSEHDFAGAGGRFEIADLRPGDYALWINAPGRAAWVLQNLRIPEALAAPIEIDARLAAGEQLAGRVIEAATGAPVAGALVISEADTPANMVHLQTWEYPAGLVPAARTDADGRFVLEHLRSRATILRATAPGFAPAWLKADPAIDGAPELRLGPGSIVRGRVEDGAGAPEPDVALVVAPTESGERPLYWIVLATTGPDGTYEAVDLPAGRTVVVKLGSMRDRTNWGPPQSLYPKLEPGVPQRADFLVAREGAGVTGRLLDASGAPLVDRGLSILPRDKSPEEAEGNWRSTTSGADGTYDFATVPPGEYDVYASPDSPMEVVWVGVVAIEPERVLVHDIVVPAGVVAGKVIDDATGAPVPAPVLILHRMKGARWCFTARVLAAPDGTFAIPFLLDGEYRLSVLPVAGPLAAGRVESVHVEGGTAPELELRLRPGATLDITVVDAGGAPLAEAAVRLFDESGLELEYKQSQVTDEQGRLSFTGFPAGRLRVAVEKAGFARVERELLLAPGQAAAERFELQARQR